MAEWNLATLEILKERKSASKSDVARAQSIADDSLEICRMFASLGDAHASGCMRVATFITKETKREEAL
jgi:hypothetical protein